MITALVCFSIAGAYVYIENCYSDEVFDAKTSIEKQLYVKYCADDYSINPFDSYSSKIETLMLYICWVVGAWNLFDALILMGVLKTNNKPEDCLNWKIINSKSYQNIVTKIKKVKNHDKSKKGN